MAKIGSLFGDVSIRTKGLEKGIKKANRMLYRFGRSAQGAGKNITAGVGAPIAALGVTSFNTFRNFEQEMAKVQAISGATGDEFKGLEKLAKDLGSSTRFTATQVSQLQLNLSKLGFSTKEIHGATGAILDLSLATGEDLAESARVAASVVRAFGYDAKDTNKVVDVMAKSFSSSALDLMKFDTAMANVGAIAKTTNVPLEEVSAMLAVLVDRGIDASSAGTGLRNMFLKLEKHGLSFSEAVDRINNSVKPASTALELFGIRGVTVGQTIARNTDLVASLTQQFANAGGAATEMAAIMDDTVTGSFFKVQSAVEGVLIKLGELNEKAFKTFLDRLASFVQTNQVFIAQFLKITMVVGSVITAFGLLLLVTGTLGLALAGTLSLLTLIGIKVVLIVGAVALAVGAIGYLTVKFFGLENTIKGVVVVVKTFTGILRTVFNAATIITRSVEAMGLVFKDVMDGIFRIVKATVSPVLNMLSGLATGLAALGDITNPKKMLKGLRIAKEKIALGFSDALSFDRVGAEVDETLQNVAGRFSGLKDGVKQDLSDIADAWDFTGEDEEGGALGEAVDVVVDKVNNLKQTILGEKGEGFWEGFATSFKQAAQNIGQETKILSSDLDTIFSNVSNNMTDSLMEFFETGKLGMRDMVNDMLKQFQRLIVQRSIVNPLLSMGLNFLGDTFGLQFQDSVKVDGARANGGSVTAGKQYLVGEQGMELFVPRSSGTIVPNHALAGGQPPINVNFQVDATDANSFDNQMQQRQDMIVGMVEQAFNRQGRVGIYG
jgi:hypothetical protein